ncbi:MAG: CRISPR-associated endonuclease Cas2 [Ignavibacteriales bacterium]|nr:CRISPR-associated endonuclease Cas2 [Ignavibacteriales bacterium]
MYYILTYDIASAKRLPKALKKCRKYLNWVQNSVFEGELTTSQMERLISELKEVIDKKKDSLLIYTARTREVIDREIIGVDKNELTNFF